MFKIQLIPGQELPNELVLIWDQLLQGLPHLDSPYFRPEFTQLIASVRQDVEVATLYSGADVVGFFPFQRGRFGRGKPVGGRLSDFHGVVCDPQMLNHFPELLSQSQLTSYQFDHLLVGQFPQTADLPHAGSPYLSMADGFEAYEKTQRHYSKHYAQYTRKLNKIQREHGQLRFQMFSESEADFQQLLAWKIDQYERTGAFNPMKFSWTVDALRSCWRMRSPEFRGVFSTCHLGDQLLGAHFGMQAGPVLHYWFPAYNPEFHKYSPGNLLLLEIARAMAEIGINKIDFGKGSEDYKLTFGTAQTLVMEGCAQQASLINHIDGSMMAVKSWLKSSPFHRPAKATAQFLRPVREWLAFR